MANPTVTSGAENRYQTVEGTLAQVMTYLDAHKIPRENVITVGYSGIADKLFFASFRLGGI